MPSVRVSCELGSLYVCENMWLFVCFGLKGEEKVFLRVCTHARTCVCVCVGGWVLNKDISSLKASVWLNGFNVAPAAERWCV